MNQLETDTYPEKIYVEITTRCNLHCRMCVKYAAGSAIVGEHHGHIEVLYTSTTKGG